MCITSASRHYSTGLSTALWTTSINVPPAPRFHVKPVLRPPFGPRRTVIYPQGCHHPLVFLAFCLHSSTELSTARPHLRPSIHPNLALAADITSRLSTALALPCGLRHPSSPGSPVGAVGCPQLRVASPITALRPAVPFAHHRPSFYGSFAGHRPSICGSFASTALVLRSRSSITALRLAPSFAPAASFAPRGFGRHFAMGWATWRFCLFHSGHGQAVRWRPSLVLHPCAFPVSRTSRILHAAGRAFGNAMAETMPPQIQ